MAIILLASLLLMRLLGSVQSRSDQTATRQDMELILAKLRGYYLAHEQLPPAAGSGGSEVPVQVGALDMEQHFRLDGWGHYYRYDPGDVTLIQDVQDSVSGRSYAASLRSAGPDERLHTGDDLVLYLDLTPEGARIVRRKLAVLEEEVQAYDALFAGVDNDGDGELDEDALNALSPDNVGGGCLPLQLETQDNTGNLVITNDPASGLPTLDHIEAQQGGVYGCEQGHHLAWFLARAAGLPVGFPGGYDIDPWGRPLYWGAPTLIEQYGGYASNDSTVRGDFRYHHFYSQGPHVENRDDDIISKNR